MTPGARAALSKYALSADKALAVLAARQAEGARVAPRVLEQAHAASGQATTPALLRRAALHASESARAGRAAQSFAALPAPAAAKRRAEHVMALEETAPARMYDLPRGPRELLEGGYLHSPEKADLLFGSAAQLHDPAGLLQPAAPRADVAGTVAQGARRKGPVRAPDAKVAAYRDGERQHLPGLSQVTGYPGRSQQPEVDPVAQISAAFDQHELRMRDPGWEMKQGAAHKLHYRTHFRDLPISIENRAGSYRHWHDPHTGKGGKTLMKYPYGYIRKSKGLDGDHVDCFIGPDKDAPNVYVIMTKKAPKFEELDEEKCMLGFSTAKAARKAFHAHYDDTRFFHSMTEVPFDTFAKRVEETYTGDRKKVANLAASAPLYASVAYYCTKIAGEGSTVGSARRAQGIGVSFTPVVGTHEKPLGFPPSGPLRKLPEPMSIPDRISRQFNYMDMPQHTTGIDNM